MPETTRRVRLLRAGAAALATTLALTACSGGDDADEAGDTGDTAATGTPTPSDTESVEVPEGEEVTEPGSQLAFGDTATVAYELDGQAGVLGLTVESAAKGSLDDFSGFDMSDPYKRRGSYYYVRVSVENAGEEPFGDAPVPLWGISGDNKLLRAVQFKTSFTKCPTETLPKKFEPGDSFTTCLVYLSPDKGSLEGLSYRPTEDYTPIEWRGEVKKPAKDKKRTQGKKAGKPSKG